MKSLVGAALGAGLVAALAANSAAQASIVDFGAGAFDGAITYTGSSLDQSIVLDLDQSILVVMEVGPGDSSGLSLFDTVTLSALTTPPGSAILYGFTPGPLGADVIVSWTAGADTFTETLTSALSINRATTDELGLSLSGTLSDTRGAFKDSPVLLALTANQAGGPGQIISASFTNTSRLSSVPEASTWAMIALGFAALGYASRRRKTNVSMLSA